MADSVVRNANKDDIPIFDPDTDLGDQYLMENQNFDFLEEDPDELLERMYNNPPKDLNDEMMDRFVTFGGSEMEGGLADPSGILDAPMSDKVYMREGGLAMAGGGPLDSFRQFLMETIDQQQVDPFIDEVNQMASERFNLGGISSGGQSVFGPVKASIFEPPQQQDMMARPLSFYNKGVAEPLLRPSNPFQIVEREPMGLRGGPNMFNIDQQIFNDGFMPGKTQLTGELPRTFAEGGGVASLMKKTTVEMQETPADRNMLVMNRIMKQGGVNQSRDPRLMAQLAQVLGRDG